MFLIPKPATGHDSEPADLSSHRHKLFP